MYPRVCAEPRLVAYINDAIPALNRTLSLTTISQRLNRSHAPPLHRLLPGSAGSAGVCRRSSGSQAARTRRQGHYADRAHRPLHAGEPRVRPLLWHRRRRAWLWRSQRRRQQRYGQAVVLEPRVAPTPGGPPPPPPPPPPGVTHLLPWYINHQGGDANERWQCSVAGSNGWQQNHAAYDNGNVNKWAAQNTPFSLAYYKRADIPLHFAVAEAWTLADNYHESVIGSTNPNRISWLAGTVGIDEAKRNLGGPAIDNAETAGCETASDGSSYSCYPYRWRTLPEYLEQVGISWQVYQDTDNFDDNPLAWFSQFQQAPNNSALARKGMSFVGLDRFYADAKQGTLPQVSVIIGPTELSEHPPYGPLDGAWLQKSVVDAVTTGAKYASTALIVSYDETGGWADHVMASFPLLKEAPDEWIVDPYNASLGAQPVGPGFRVPLYVVSPFTRSGGVFSEPAAHESQILFVEQWARAIGKPFKQQSITPWRRSQLSDLTAMFDFSSKDTSLPVLPDVRAPSQDSAGNYNGYATCKAKYGALQPLVRWQQADDDAWVLESGFKRVRGTPSEGHFYVFELAGRALSFDLQKGVLATSAAVKDHSAAEQRFVVHATSRALKNNAFYLTPAAVAAGQYIGKDGRLTADVKRAAVFTFDDARDGKGYAIRADAKLPGGFEGKGGASIFSVTY
ncbi:related to Phospholipase C [Sporisorium reilianum f. sp. reilianum]|uniref:Related to Phospholipase C n=1 Tax=Sporisorium reilianum f. sp. reilianum TaxID=72559 RepID=A0A2N8UP75_9BASI|nr:related to Phospholipase C [Sporisorium reilianum f. sp. reilianum]